MIKANFNTYASYVTDSLYQWDLNQILSVSGLNLSVAPEVHFSNANMDKAIVRQATMSNHVVSVQIPNSLLQDPLTIYAHIGIYEGDKFKIVEKVEIPVIPKERPIDYQIQDSDEEIYSFNRVLNALNNKADSAQVANIIAHNNDVEGNTELVDMRTADDGTIYNSAGDAFRNHYARTNIIVTNFSGAVPFDFNFTEKTITIRAYTRVSHANKQVFNATKDVVIAITEREGINANHILCYDLRNNQFVDVSQHDAINTKLIPIAGYYYNRNSVDIMYNSLQCPYTYTLEGVAPDYIDKISAAHSRHRFGVVGNAFGKPIDFNLTDFVITIPTHTYLFDGETRVFYNGGEIGALSVTIPSESGVKALVYNLSAAAWEVRSYGGVFVKNVDTILVATWWPGTVDSIVCLSHYTINGANPNHDELITEISDNVRAEIAAHANTLADKKVLIIGDSISADYYGDYEKWVTKLCTTGFFHASNVVNDSVHATGFVAQYNDGDNDFNTRIRAITEPEKYDLVIVFGGINDYIQHVPMGEKGGSDLTQFKPAVDHFFEYLANTFVNSRICILSPLRTSATWANNVGEYVGSYAEYIREVAKSYCLPVLNLTDESGFYPWVTSFREKWTLIPDGYNVTDGVHPTEEYEEKYLAPMIRGFLEKIF